MLNWKQWNKYPVTTRGHDIHPFPYSDPHCTLQLDENNPQIYLLHTQLQQQQPQQQQQQQQSQLQQLPQNRPKYSQCLLYWLVNAKSGQRISIELYDFSSIPSLIPTVNTPSKTSQNSRQNGKLTQQSDKQGELNRFPVAHQSNSAPLHRTMTQNQRYQHQHQLSSSSHCLISVTNIHDLINVTANVETFDPSPSYTLCGSDLNALDEELKSIMKEKGTKVKILETWLQAYESRGSSVKLEMLPSRLKDTVYLLKLEGKEAWLLIFCFLRNYFSFTFSSEIN